MFTINHAFQPTQKVRKEEVTQEIAFEEVTQEVAPPIQRSTEQQVPSEIKIP